MITGTGIDIVQIKRMENWLINKKLLERYFHHEEILLAFSRGKNAAECLAARFAAKEAFSKAIGTGLACISLKDIMISNAKNGKPEIKLFGTAQEAFEKSGANRIHVSLSHEKDNAIAMIVLEGI